MTIDDKLLAAILGILTAIITSVGLNYAQVKRTQSQNQKDAADAAESLSVATMNSLDSLVKLQDQVDRLSKDSIAIASLQYEVSKLKMEMGTIIREKQWLEFTLTKNGIKIEPVPPGWVPPI